ncbi:hypothetical protein AB6A40_000107 [Gnathostoma spinigerum]|uniref:Uncharacterized protein n=1 Tax=Gnathostoma spinigerum TaxID=75299 RepID=A0ABD6E1I6_9BILA
MAVELWRPSNVLMRYGEVLAFGQLTGIILAGFLQFVHSIICFEWFRIHGMKLTRNAVPLFDERNLLETTNNLNFYPAPVLDDTTPAGIPESRLPGLLAVFRNEKDERMQQWYKQHYGKVYENAMKAMAERKSMQKVVRKEEEMDKAP